MAKYRVISSGNIVLADEPFMELVYPGDFELIEQAGRADAVLSRLAEIDKLGESPRALREALLGNTAWIASLDAEAAKLRDELKGL